MIEWIVSSSILIVAVLLLRLIFRNQINKRLQYALWGLVVLRLLIPGSVVESAASIGNLFSEFTEQTATQVATGALEQDERYELVFEEVLASRNLTPEQYQAFPRAQREAIVRKYEPEIQKRLDTYEQACNTAQLLNFIWAGGCIAVALFLLLSNLGFYCKLRRSRKKLNTVVSLPVYTTAVVQTPCLFGLLRPAIYLPEDAADDKQALQYILVHELTHYHHLDHIWSTLRCVCLALHWYNPLVWIAVKVSRMDSELACDEGTLQRLGDDNRENYGRTLIEMSRARPSVQDFLLTATTMTGDKKSLYRRIQAIAKKPRFILTAVISLAVLLLVIVGCTFTGANQDTEPTATEPTAPEETTLSQDTTAPPQATAPPETTVPPETTESNEPEPYHEDIMAVPMVRMMGMLYVLDKEADSLTQQLPAGYVYLGTGREDNDRIPSSRYSYRHIPSYTDIYGSLENPDYLYYNTGSGYQRLIRAALVENNLSRNDPENWKEENYITAFFASLLVVDPDNPYNQATNQVFTQPEGVDLRQQFYNGFPEWSQYAVPLSDAERAFLSANGWDERRIYNAERYPVSTMDARLQRFFGITYDQCWKVGLDQMGTYMEETQCYYQFVSDVRGYRTTIQSVEYDAQNGLYYVTYHCDNYRPVSVFRMTLIKGDGAFLIYSNVPVE